MKTGTQSFRQFSTFVGTASGWENALRQSLLYSRGDFSIFFIRPIPAVIITFAIALLVIPAFFAGRKKRKKVLETLEGD